jgi:hypothetical protein
VSSQQLQGQLQTQHNVDIGNSIKGKYKMKTTTTTTTIIIIIIIKATINPITLKEGENCYVYKDLWTEEQ